MIFNTNSNDSQDRTSGEIDSSSSSSSHLFSYSNFKDAELIKNMFIDSDGHLCKRNSTKNLYTHTGSPIAKSYAWTKTGNDAYGSQDLIYYIEDSEGKTTDEKSYANAITYDPKTDSYYKSVSNLSLPAPTKNYHFLSNKNDIYAIGNGNIYGYTHVSDTGFQVIQPYIPLIRVKTNSVGVGIDYEKINLLESSSTICNVRARYICDGTTREFRINDEVVGIDAVYIKKTKLTKDSDYSVSIGNIFTTIKTNYVYSALGSDNDIIEIHYRAWFTDKTTGKRPDIVNPKGISQLICNGIKIQCIYTDSYIYIASCSDCETSIFNVNPLYFPDDDSLRIDISTIGSSVLGIIPLNNNRFAVATTNGNILTYKLSQVENAPSEEDNRKIYSFKVEALNSYQDIELSNANKKLFAYNANTIYIGYDNYIKFIAINDDNSYSVNKINLSPNVQSYLNDNNLSLSDYEMHYCKEQNYIYIYSSQYDTIVYDIQNDIFYFYDGNYHIDSFVTDNIFIGADRLSFNVIQKNKYGIENDSYIASSYKSKPLSLGTVSTKLLNKVVIKTESFKPDKSIITAAPTVTVETDSGNAITLSSDISSAKNDMPITSVYESSDFGNFNDATIKVELPANIYKLDNIIFDRDILDDVTSSKDI